MGVVRAMFGASFVGRSGDPDTVAALLAERRLVSIVGEGGVGKTRLATEAASAWLEQGHLKLRATAAGSVWVALESAPDVMAAAVISSATLTVGYAPPGQALSGAAALQMRLPLAHTVVAGQPSVITMAGDAVRPVGSPTDPAVTLTVSAATGTLAAGDFSGLSAGAVAGDGHSLTLSGSASAVSAWLAQGGLRYTGPGETVQFSLVPAGGAATQGLGGAVQLIPAPAAVPVVPNGGERGGVIPWPRARSSPTPWPGSPCSQTSGPRSW